MINLCTPLFLISFYFIHKNYTGCPKSHLPKISKFVYLRRFWPNSIIFIYLKKICSVFIHKWLNQDQNTEKHQIASECGRSLTFSSISDLVLLFVDENRTYFFPNDQHEKPYKMGYVVKFSHSSVCIVVDYRWKYRAVVVCVRKSERILWSLEEVRQTRENLKNANKVF